MTDPPEAWQLLIPFSQHVRDTVGVVTERLGYSFREEQPNLIRLSNSHVFLDVSHHPRDGEVSIEFGRVGTDERYSFLLYLRARAARNDAARGDDVSWTSEEVRRRLELLARALEAHGRPILEGDGHAFSDMEKVRWWNVPDG